MPVATFLSKGLTAFEQAPELAKKQLEAGDTSYFQGKVKGQEAALLAEKAQLDALLADPDKAYSDGHNIQRLTGLADLTNEALTKGYRPSNLGTYYNKITPPDVNNDTYEEVGYTLPRRDILLTPEAQKPGSHFGIETMWVRRDVDENTGALRVFEMQSDPQNAITKANTKRAPTWPALMKQVQDSFPELVTKLRDYDAGIRATPDSMLELMTSYILRQSDSLNHLPIAKKAPELFNEAVAAIKQTQQAIIDSQPAQKLSDYPIDWSKDLINRQFVTAFNKGLDKVDFLIKPDGQYMARSEAVQKNYETVIQKRIEKLAAKLKGPNGEKATVEVVTSKSGSNFDARGMDLREFAYSEPEVVSQASESIIANLQGEQAKNFRQFVTEFKLTNQTLAEQVLSAVEEFVLEPELVYKAVSDFSNTKAAKGSTYLRVNLPKTAAGGLAAFSVPVFAQESEESKKANLAGRVQKAVAAGYSPEEIRQYLGQEFGGEELRNALTEAYKPQVEQARQAGYSEEEIQQYLSGTGATAVAPTEADMAFANQRLGLGQNQNLGLMTEATDAMGVLPQLSPAETLDTNAILPKLDLAADPQDLANQLNNITMSYEKLAKQVAGGLFGAAEFKREGAALAEKANAIIKMEMEQRGVNVLDVDAFGTVTILDPETGQPKELDEGFWASLGSGLWNTKLEIGGAITGAITGARAGAVVGGPMGAFGGGLAGGMIGAGFGRGADILNSARDIKYKVAVADLTDKMGDAATADGLIGLGVSTLWQLGKATVQGVSRAWDYLGQGNTAGAYRALKETTDLSDAQIAEVVRNWESLNSKQLLSQSATTRGQMTLADKEAALRVFGETRPELTGSVEYALDLSKTGGIKLAKAISERSADMAKQVEQITNDHAAAAAIDGLNRYIPEVKDFYQNVKMLGVEAMKDTDYRFNFNRIMSLEQSLTKARKTIRNYGLRKDFTFDLKRLREIGGLETIRAMEKQLGQQLNVNNLKLKPTPGVMQAVEQLNPNRSFSDLLDLRKVVNEIRSDRRYAQFLNFAEMDKAMKAIDGEIARAAKQMPEGDAWLRQWKAANIEYSKMKGLEENVLYKALMSDRVSAETAVKQFAKSLAYESPESFMQVMARLPDRTKRSVEGAVFKHYLDEATLTLSDNYSAINFPKLAKELEQLAFTNPETRDLKRLVKSMAEVYQNDKALAQIAWDSPAGRLKNNIATSIEGKVSMAAHSALFKKIQTLMPTASGRRAALSLKMREVLDNPLDSKAVAALKRDLPKDPELDTLLHQLAIQYVKFGKAEPGYGQASLYRVSRPGMQNKASQTSMGYGVPYYVDVKQAEKAATLTGGRLTKIQVTNKRIAQTKDVEALLGRPARPADLTNQEILDALREKDFIGITVGDKALLFKD